MITLQEYLNNKYPTQAEKEQLQEIIIGSYTLPLAETSQLAGAELNLNSYPNLKIVRIAGDYLASKLTKLDLSNCLQLTNLNVWNNQLTTLDLSHCQQLEKLYCSNNYLTQITYPTQPEAITSLIISSNNLTISDLSVFSQMRNLEWLYIGNTDQAKIKQGICNRFSGSLKFLQSCTKLKILEIHNTNLSSGLEYLPASCETIYCANTPLEPYLRNFKEIKNYCDYSAWRQVNLSLITQIQEYDKLLKIFIAINSALDRNNKTIEKTKLEKVFDALGLHLETKIKATRKQLYQAQELVNQVQVS